MWLWSHKKLSFPPSASSWKSKIDPFPAKEGLTRRDPPAITFTAQVADLNICNLIKQNTATRWCMKAYRPNKELIVRSIFQHRWKYRSGLLIICGIQVWPTLKRQSCCTLIGKDQQVRVRLTRPDYRPTLIRSIISGNFPPALGGRGLRFLTTALWLTAPSLEPIMLKTNLIRTAPRRSLSFFFLDRKFAVEWIRKDWINIFVLD